MKRNRLLGLLLLCAALLLPPGAVAHCDTLDGPVVASARQALKQADVTPVLKWVKPVHEAELKAAFERAVKASAQGGAAREVAEMYFFETAVRLHRAGEGAPYTGLKPAGREPGAAIRGADRALERGSVEELIKLVNDDVAAGIRRRFQAAREARQHAEQSVPAGREYVRAYVEFVHYVERLHADAVGTRMSHEAELAGGGERH